MFGTFKHVSDGSLPQSIMAFTPENTEVEQSRLQQLVQGTWKKQLEPNPPPKPNTESMEDSFLSRFVQLLAAVDASV